MTRARSRSGLAVLAGLAFALAAAPRTASAGAPTRAGRTNRISFAPLFDPHTRFKPKKTVKLKFRVQDKAAGAPIGSDAITFSLLHGPGATAIPLPAREVRTGVFEVPFTPAGPGQYAIAAAIRGAPADAIRPVRLGVVGVADGLIEEPPEADVDVAKRKRATHGRTR